MSEQSTEQSTAEQSGDQVYTAQVPGATDADLRTVVLAHPLTRKVDIDSLGLADSGLPEGGIPAGGKVRVRADHASALIGAGYAAGVSPDKPEEVRAVVQDDKFGKGDVEEIEQPTEEQPPVAVVTDTTQAEAAGTPGVVEAPGVGADGSTDPAAPATATSGDGAAAAQAAQTTSKAAGRTRG